MLYIGSDLDIVVHHPDGITSGVVLSADDSPVSDLSLTAKLVDEDGADVTTGIAVPLVSGTTIYRGVLSATVTKTLTKGRKYELIVTNATDRVVVRDDYRAAYRN